MLLGSRRTSHTGADTDLGPRYLVVRTGQGSTLGGQSACMRPISLPKPIVVTNGVLYSSRGSALKPEKSGSISDDRSRFGRYLSNL